LNSERGGIGGEQLGKEMMIGGPGLSAWGERGKGERPVGPAPRRRRGCAGELGQKAEKEEGGIRVSFYIFYTKFPIEILSRKKKINKTFCFSTNHHKRNAPA